MHHELLTSRSVWKNIVPGQVISSRRSGMRRKVISGGNGFVVLRKVKGQGTTTYVDCDRGYFIV